MVLVPFDILCTHTQSLSLILLPSHKKSQGLASCFPTKREIDDTEEFLFNLFNYTVYTNTVKNSSEDTKASLPLHSLSTHINMQFPVIPLLQELNSEGSVQTLQLFNYLPILFWICASKSQQCDLFCRNSILLMHRVKILEKNTCKTGVSLRASIHMEMPWQSVASSLSPGEKPNTISKTHLPDWS